MLLHVIACYCMLLHVSVGTVFLWHHVSHCMIHTVYKYVKTEVHVDFWGVCDDSDGFPGSLLV